MKKILLSGTVIAAFVIYSFVLRQAQSAARIAEVITPTTAPSSAPTDTPSPTTVATTAASPPPTDTPSPAVKSGKYRDGEYTGPAADAFYGYVQVKAVIRNGLIADVQFLQYPTDADHSREISAYSTPILRSEAISAQSAQVDTVSGATDTSAAFVESLSSALSQAL